MAKLGRLRANAPLGFAVAIGGFICVVVLTGLLYDTLNRGDTMDADPIFAAIGAARRSLAMLQALGEGAAADKEFDAASVAYDDLVRELLRTQPTTLAGLLAYVRYIRDCENAGDKLLTTVMDEEESATDVMLATIVSSLEQFAGEKA